MKYNLKFCLFSGLFAAAALLPNLHYVASDDSLFYLQIAFDNLSLGQPSFNGSVITNGFHPLQMILLLILKNLFFFADKQTFMYLAFFIGIAINCLSINLLSKTCRWFYNNPVLEFTTCAAFTFYIFGGMYFSEASINALMLNWLLWRCTAKSDLTSKSASIPIAIPALSALCILARLDNIFSIAFLFTYQFYKARNIRTLLSPFICALILLPYLLYNYSYFGAFMPVSGQIKSTFPEIRSFVSAWDQTTLLSRMSAFLLLLTLLLGVIDKQRNKILNCFLAGALINWGYYFLFQEASFHSWYFVQAILLIAICLPSSLNNLIKLSFLNFLFKKAAITLLVILPISTFYKGYTQGCGNLNELIMGRTWGKIIYFEVAARANQYLTDQEKVLVFDLPGYFAYFGNLSVFAIDCLTLNKQACQELYADPQAFINNNQIKKIIWSLPGNCQESLELKAYYSQKTIGSVRLDCSEAVILNQEHNIVIAPILN